MPHATGKTKFRSYGAQKIGTFTPGENDGSFIGAGDNTIQAADDALGRARKAGWTFQELDARLMASYTNYEDASKVEGYTVYFKITPK